MDFSAILILERAGLWTYGPLHQCEEVIVSRAGLLHGATAKLSLTSLNWILLRAHELEILVKDDRSLSRDPELITKSHALRADLDKEPAIEEAREDRLSSVSAGRGSNSSYGLQYCPTIVFRVAKRG
jgi:hypothetical protein